MMKKLIYCAAALATALFAGSCQQELLDTPAGENTVTYTVELPDVQTKAIGDGTNVDQLVYEVWKTGEDGVITESSTRLYQKTINLAPEAPRKWIVTLNLVQNQTYKALFWAQVGKPKGHENYNTDQLTNVYYAYDVTKDYSSNQESYAAFYGTDVLDTHTPLKGKTITLTRPFAQLNIGTLNTALEDEYAIDMLQSSVEVTVPTQFNVATSEVANSQKITFNLADVPNDPATLSVSGTEYDYVAMNYVFAGAKTTSSVEYTIETTITPTASASTATTATINKTIPNVPLQENYRTNIVGNLLTSKADYTITLDPDFGEGDYYGPEFVKTPAYDDATNTWTITCRDELLYVAQQVNTGANSFVGQTVKVVNDIDLKNIPWTPIGHSTSVTFRGMFEGAAVTKAATEYPTISNLKIENGSISGFFGLMCNGGKVRNINFNNVTISGERQLGVVAGQVYGNLEQPTIENVTVENAVITAVPALDGAVYDNGDKVGGIAGLIGQQAYIKGCTVKNSTFTGYRDMGGIVGCTQNGHSCNLTDNHTEHINFVVTSKYVPYKDNTPHGATGAIRGGTRSNAGDVIEGNTSSEGTISEVVLVNDQVSLQNAINAAGLGETQIKFVNDITGNIVVIQKPGVKITIDGFNKKYNGFIKVHSNSNHYADAALTIKNVNFEHSELLYNAKGEPYFNFIEALENGAERYSTNITAENCTFTATGDAVNTAVGLQIKSSKWAKVLSCTATNMHSLIQAQSCDETVVVNGCTINGKNGVAFKQVKSATVEDCTITANGDDEGVGYGIRFDGNTDNYGITVKDNTISAVQPFIVRRMTGANNTITLEGTNTLSTTADYQIVITNGNDNEKYSKPTGTYELTGVKNYSVYEGKPIAKVGNTEYDNISDALAAWANNTTLTLMSDVTLSNAIQISSTEYRVLDLGTYTMTAAKSKDAIEIVNNGRSSASYALDIKADATNPGGITATSMAVVKTTGKSGVQDRPIIRFYNGVFNASNIISHSGSNGTNSPQFIFYNGVYNGNISTNRAICIFEGGTFNGKFYMSVDSSSYARIGGGRFKELKNNYGSSLNSSKLTIGSSKGVFDRGVYVDDDGYIVVEGPVITEFGDKFEAKTTNIDAYGTGTFGSYLPYSSVPEYGLYYTKAEMAISKHGKDNVVLPTPAPKSNEIWYTSYEMKLEPTTSSALNANIVSNVWDSNTGEGVITFDAPLTTVGNEAFQRNTNTTPSNWITSISLPKTVTTIGNYAFYQCFNLTSITIPDGVESIGQYAFGSCQAATTVTIGSSVTSIASGAFYGCWELKQIICKSTTPPTIADKWVFHNIDENPTVIVPAASVDAYKAANFWSSLNIVGE